MIEQTKCIKKYTRPMHLISLRKYPTEKFYIFMKYCIFNFDTFLKLLRFTTSVKCLPCMAVDHIANISAILSHTQKFCTEDSSKQTV